MSSFEDVTETEEGSGITRQMIEEIVPFLRDPRPEIRQAAATTAVAASATREGATLLQACGAVKWLCRISGDVGTIAKDAVSALVNVSAEETAISAVEDMCKAGIVNRLMEVISAEECSPRVRDLSLQLLANVTRVQVGAEKLAQAGAGSSREGHHIRRLVRWVTLHPAGSGQDYPPLPDSQGCKGHSLPPQNSDINEGRDKNVVLDQWQQCANILCNATRIPEGRRALRHPQPGALQQLLPQLSSPNPVRRWGIAACVRNCCFEELDHPWLLHDVKIVPHLLARLSDDGDEYDFDEKVILDPRVWRKEEDGPPKKREPCGSVKKDLLEALLQLCSTLDSRHALRKMGVYYVVRELDKAELDEEISQVCYNLVNFLQRDEEDRQDRIKYLQSLKENEEPEVDPEANASSSSENPRVNVNESVCMPAPSSPGSVEDRKAFLGKKLAEERAGETRDIAPELTPSFGDQLPSVMKEGDSEEESVDVKGADAVAAMLSTFDDSDEDR